MHVLEYEKDRSRGSEGFEAANECRQGLLFSLRGLEVRIGKMPVVRNRQQIGEQGQIFVVRIGGSTEQRLQQIEFLCRRMAMIDAGGPLELGDHGMKGAVLIVRQTLIPDAHMRLGGNGASKLLGQA